MKNNITDAMVEAAILASTTIARAHEQNSARWPDDYDEDERAVIIEMYRAALEAAPTPAEGGGWIKVEDSPAEWEGKVVWWWSGRKEMWAGGFTEVHLRVIPRNFDRRREACGVIYVKQLVLPTPPEGE
jgi:hypothetical protein